MLTSDLINQLNKPEYKDFKILFRSERTHTETQLVPIGSVDYFNVLVDKKQIILCQEWF